MIRFGLFGAQLRLKLELINRLKNERFSLGGSGILKKLIDAIDTLLDSLLAATGLDEALKELSELVRRLTGDLQFMWVIEPTSKSVE